MIANKVNEFKGFELTVNTAAGAVSSLTATVLPPLPV
jgi:hypothetical protein